MQPTPSNTMTVRAGAGSAQLANSARDGNGTPVNVDRLNIISLFGNICSGSSELAAAGHCAGPLPSSHGKQSGRPERLPRKLRCGEDVSPTRRTPSGRCRAAGAASDRSAMAGISTLSSARRARHAGGGAGGAAVRSPGFPARRRSALEARWRTTLDRVTALSVAYHEAAAVGPPELAAPSAGQAADARSASPGDRDVSRLARRVVAERQALAEIEAALDRISGGRYGRCEQCHRRISAGLLTAQPEARFCSACSRHFGHLAVGGRPGTA
jgi:DnaK suppressor protein